MYLKMSPDWKAEKEKKQAKLQELRRIRAEKERRRREEQKLEVIVYNVVFVYMPEFSSQE